MREHCPTGPSMRFHVKLGRVLTASQGANKEWTGPDAAHVYPLSIVVEVFSCPCRWSPLPGLAPLPDIPDRMHVAD